MIQSHKRHGGAALVNAEDNILARPDWIAAPALGGPPNVAPTFDAPDFAITRVSTGALGEQANGSSFLGAVSPDGSKLVFYSTASNLVATVVPGADVLPANRPILPLSESLAFCSTRRAR